MIENSMNRCFTGMRWVNSFSDMLFLLVCYYYLWYSLGLDCVGGGVEEPLGDERGAEPPPCIARDEN